MKSRELFPIIEQDLLEKMVFLGGPRQVGKTTLAKQLLKKSNGLYLNWDQDKDRSLILKQEFPSQKNALLVLDEIHKYTRWRNFLKGIYDTKEESLKILVTGSARLDILKKVGDSLQGRYFYHRLLPLSSAELKITSQNDFMNLYELSGFPEPFFKQSKLKAQRWSADYQSRLVHGDIASLTNLQDLGTLELLQNRLPDLVGSPLSLNSLREDLNINHSTVTRWVIALEKIYSIFRVSPFGAPQIKAVKKEQKHYHYDWTLCSSESGARFENMVAVHLLKWVYEKRDQLGKTYELRFFKERNVVSREIDFIILYKNKPILAIECKNTPTDDFSTLLSFKRRFPNVSCWQIYLKGNKDYTRESVRCTQAMNLLNHLDEFIKD